MKIKNKNKLPYYGVIVLLHFVFSCNLIAQVPDSLKTKKYKLIVDETFLPLITKKDSINSLNKLENDIKNIIYNSNLGSSNFGILIQSLDNDKIYYAENENKLLTPASTTKLLTSFLNIHLIGKTGYISTRVLTDGKVSKNGILNGNIYLIGAGDPTFSEYDITELVKQLVDKKITKINGNIYADGSLFDGIYDRLKYSGDRDVVEPLPPISALSIEKNRALINISSNSSNMNPHISITPSSNYFIINNSVKMSMDNSIKQDKENFNTLHYHQQYGDEMLSATDDLAYYKPKKSKYRNPLSVSTSMSSEGLQNINIKGTVSKGRSYSYSVEIKKPELASAGSLYKFLIEAGIEIDGNIGECCINDLGANEFTKIAAVDKPLLNILSTLNKNSDNYIAEHLFKINGSMNGFSKNNTQGSRNLTNKILDSFNIYNVGCSVNDGSGLSRRNLLTASTLVGILNYAHKNKEYKILSESLSIAGVDGTLRNRFKNTLAENNLIAKTGTLRNVSSLAGYVTTLDGETISFAIICNGNEVWKFKDLENKIGTYLSEFFYFSNSN